MNAEKVKDLFQRVAVWKKGAQRAPHKPLLILYAIGRMLRGEPRMIPFLKVDKDLKKLLIEFGPRRKSYHPEYPFWRLKNDNLWDLANIGSVKKRGSGADAKRKDLLQNNVSGGFPVQIYNVLSKDSKLVFEIVTNILKLNFPDTIHQDILDSVGIDIPLPGRKSRIRDPEFRERVLRAYEYKCAICGFDVRLGNQLVAIEAAHIKWHQAGGPDKESNGLSLCTLHHKLFDRKVFTITDTRRIIVSEDAHGTKGFQEWLMAFHNKTIQLPQSRKYYPEDKFISWHIREVFQGPGRYCSSRPMG